MIRPDVSSLVYVCVFVVHSVIHYSLQHVDRIHHQSKKKKQMKKVRESNTDREDGANEKAYTHTHNTKIKQIK